MTLELLNEMYDSLNLSKEVRCALILKASITAQLSSMNEQEYREYFIEIAYNLICQMCNNISNG